MAISACQEAEKRASCMPSSHIEASDAGRMPALRPRSAPTRGVAELLPLQNGGDTHVQLAVGASASPAVGGLRNRLIRRTKTTTIAPSVTH